MKISQMPEATSVDAADLLVANDGGTTSKMTGTTFDTYVKTGWTDLHYLLDVVNVNDGQLAFFGQTPQDQPAAQDYESVITTTQWAELFDWSFVNWHDLSIVIGANQLASAETEMDRIGEAINAFLTVLKTLGLVVSS